MTVLIKGVDMPENCNKCFVKLAYCPSVRKQLGEIGEGVWLPSNYRHADCPLKAVSKPHGRLIDEDEITSELNRLLGKYGFRKEHYDAFRTILHEVEYIPTIIEAEE